MKKAKNKKNNVEKIKLTAKEKKETQKALNLLNQPTQFPEQVLNILGEFSPEGYFLCTLQDGTPVITYHTHTDTAALALVTQIGMWADLTRNIHQQIFNKNYFDSGDENEEEQPKH